MAAHQRKIKPAQKRQLLDEAGDKCANPGCANWRLHVHHIKHWAVYKCHDSADMIAICPSCHDAVHHGSLKVPDATLYLWKNIERPSQPDTVQLFVEPALQLKLLTGTIAISTTNDRAAVFELSNSNRLRLRVLDGDVLQVSSRLQNQKGQEVLRVVENHVRVARDKNITFEFRAGKARVTVPATEEYIPQWVVTQMQVDAPDFAANGRVVALDLEVLKPGLLRVQGFWPSERGTVVITVDALSFCRPGALRPLSLIGDGEGSVLMYAGPITTAMFGLA